MMVASPTPPVTPPPPTASSPKHKKGSHEPVMLQEVLETLAPQDGGLYVDCTFGAGGYSKAILAAADCQVIGIDQDPSAIAAGRALAEQPEFQGLTLVQGNFKDIAELVQSVAGERKVDGIVFDLGVSSMQIDQADRGFSFRFDGPLDMRMSQSGLSAADLVNTADQDDLANIIYEFGEERRSRAVARAIVAARAKAPITRTSELADIVRSVVRRSPSGGIDPATRTFQGLRVYLNAELGALESGLLAAERILNPGGRLVVVSFHSLEDRLVKTFLSTRSGRSGSGQSRYFPDSALSAQRQPTFSVPSGRALKPRLEEENFNPRARSARLRFALRTEALAWEEQTSDQPSKSG